MPLSHWRYVAVQKYGWWNCRQNIFTELTLVYGIQDASLDIRNVLCVVHWLSGAPECRLFPIKLQTRSDWVRLASWTASVHSRWCHKSPSTAGQWPASNQPNSMWWLLSQHWIGGSEIAVACRRSCLLLCKPRLRWQFPLGQGLWQICFWDRLPCSRLAAVVVAHDVRIIYQKACV